MSYDLIVVGAGPGGYVAAERAGAAGKTVLLIEQEELGGVCLNRGCIPTKTLLNSAKLYDHMQHSEQFGVRCSDPVFDLERAMSWKQKVMDTLRKGIAYQMKRFGVEQLKGRAELLGAGEVSVEGKRYQGQAIIIATGSSPVIIPVPGIEQEHVLTSAKILELERLPDSLLIIGGGVIGMEFASFFSRVGVQVSVVELLPEVIPFLERDFAALLRKSLKPVNFYLETQVTGIEGNSVLCRCGGEELQLEAQIVLLSVGRRPNVENLGLEGLGLDFGKNGIRVNERMQTSVPGVYAVGDVTGISLLAHSASRMAEVAVNNLCGRRDRFREEAIPSVVYTDPEIAVVGLSEEQAAKEGRAVRTAQLPLRVNGRYLAENGHAKGQCKVVVDAQNSVLLGVQIMGGPASEIIFGAVAMIEAELRVQDIQEIVFPHPSVSEILRDSLLGLSHENLH